MISILTAILILNLFFFVSVFSQSTLWEPYSSQTTTTPELFNEGLTNAITKAARSSNSTDIIFIGNSISFNWTRENYAGKDGIEFWQQYFAPLGAINMGIGSDRTQGMLYRLANGNLDFKPGVVPKVAVCMLGTNNIDTAFGKNTVEETAEGVRAVVQFLRRKLPYTKILLYGIFPRDRFLKGWLAWRVPKVNEIIRHYADNKSVYYIDIGAEFIKPDGKIDETLMWDGLHLFTSGYEIWGNSILENLKILTEAPLDVIKIMPLGNSITEAVNSEFSYRSHLDTLLHREGIFFDFVGSMSKHNNNKAEPGTIRFDPDHEGHWGKEADWLLPRVGDYARAANPELVLMHVGTNDILHEITTENPMSKVITQTILEISQIIDTLRLVNPAIKIALAQLIPNKERDVQEFNLKLPEFVRNKSTGQSPIVLVDQWTGFKTTADLTDRWHPNKEGAVKMADNWLSGIKELVRNPTAASPSLFKHFKNNTHRFHPFSFDRHFLEQCEYSQVKFYDLKGAHLLTLDRHAHNSESLSLIKIQSGSIGFVKYFY